MVKQFVILTFEFVGENPMALTFLKNNETSLVERLHVLFLFLGILKIWNFLVHFHLPSVSSDYLGINGGGM